MGDRSVGNPRGKVYNEIVRSDRAGIKFAAHAADGHLCSGIDLMISPTVIIRHPKENAKKCSILALRGRSDCLILRYPIKDRPNLANYVRLAAEGPELSAADRECGLLLLDASWRWAEVMEREFQDVPPRSLHGYQTAYPRISKLGTDPTNGLASIEALFLAYHILGRPTEGLLSDYRWAEEFLRLNHLVAR